LEVLNGDLTCAVESEKSFLVVMVLEEAPPPFDVLFGGLGRSAAFASGPDCTIGRMEGVPVDIGTVAAADKDTHSC